MTEKLKQTIKEEILNLSKEAQQAIGTVDWINIAEEIGKKSIMREEDITNFQVETLLVLVGLEDANSYSENIENNVGVTKEKAESLTKEVLEKIFKPIKKSMEEIITKNLDKKAQKWNQNVDFIVSGGDYSAFVEKRNFTSTVPDKDNNKISTTSVPNPENMKKVEDLKSKFTI